MLAGDGEPAAWKAELLAAPARGFSCSRRRPATGSPRPRARRRPPRSARLDARLTSRARYWRCWRRTTTRRRKRFRAAARRAGALVNVIDRPAFCDFSFGSIVERSPLVVGVSTDGAAPVFAQAVRSRIEAMVPETLRAWAEAARAWRPRWAGLAQSRRRAIWLDFAERAFASVDRAPGEADFEALSAAAARPGRLIVVGIGARRRRSPDFTRGAGVAGGRPCGRGRRRCRRTLRAFGRREASVERCPEGAGAACGRRRRRASPPARRWSC